MSRVRIKSALQLFVFVIVFSSAQRVCGQDLEALSTSPIWQVRYCVSAEFKIPNAQARRLLEQLAADANPGVGRSAFSHYSRLFINVDPKIVRKAFVSV